MIKVNRDVASGFRLDFRTFIQEQKRTETQSGVVSRVSVV
jgi:hypothetical protein